MDLGRRELLKLGGGAAVGAVGIEGYRGATSGSWVYDPAELTAARNKYFARIDYETFYELQREYDTPPEEVTTPTGSSFDPAELTRFAAVGSASISGHNGVPTSQLSIATAGSFERDVIEDVAAESDTIDQLDRQPNGYRLWEAPLPDGDPLETAAVSDSATGDPSPAQELPGTPGRPDHVGVGTDDGTVVTSVVMAPEADVGSMDGVETMISAEDGGVGSPDLLEDDRSYRSIRTQFGSDPTFLFGAMLDPAAVTLATAAYQFVLGFAGGVGAGAGAFLEQWVEDVRGVAVGGDVDLEAGRTAVRLFLTYTSGDDARQTGIVQLANAASATAEEEDVDVTARYEGPNVVIEAEGDTESVFELSA